MVSKEIYWYLADYQKTNVYVYNKDRDEMRYDMSRILLYQTQKFAISLVFSIMALIILFKVSFIFPWRTDNIYTFFFKNKNICLLLIFYKNNDNGYQQETEFFSAAVVAISMVYICTDRFIGDLYLWRFSHVL